jgi:predicted permease
VPPNTIPDEADVSLNLPVLIFALLVSGFTSVICGLAPALHTAGRDVSNAMREASRSLAGGTRQAMTRKVLVVVEVALSLMLLAGSSVLFRSFVEMGRVTLEAPPERILTLRVPLAPQRYPDAPRRIGFFRELLPRIQALPGIEAVGVNSGLHPFGASGTPAEVSGEPAVADPVQAHQVSAGYTKALGIRLAAGRLLTDGDVEAAHRVALVNERFVRTRVPGRPPLGQTVRLLRFKDPPFNVANHSFQIVGVVHDTPNTGLTEPVMPEVYVPFTAIGNSNLVVVRTQGDPTAVTRAVVSQVYAVDAGQPVTNVTTVAQLLMEEQFATPRFNLVLLSVFALVGLALAVVGVYGVMSSAVAQERQEIGVRMALGADTGTITRMVLARGSRLLLAGTAVGLLGSFAVGRWLAGAVWRVSGFDPVAFSAVALLLLVVGLQACYWPARRAARIDPLIAMRESQ